MKILYKELQIMANRFILNETSYHGAGAIKEIPTEVKGKRSPVFWMTAA